MASCNIFKNQILPRTLRLFRARHLFFGCFIGLILAATFFLQQTNFLVISSVPYHILKHPLFNVSLDILEGGKSPVTSCQFARVHPFNPSVWKYFEEQKDIVCSARQPRLVFIDDTGVLRFNVSEMLRYGYGGDVETSSLSCKVYPVLRPDGEDGRIVLGAAIPFTPTGMILPYDFVLVKCHSLNFFKQFSVEAFSGFLVHARNLTRKVNFQTNSYNTLRPTLQFSNLGTNPLNIVIFGVDSMSRLAFMRLYPLTFKYLTEVMSAKVMRGMNKVADNTFPNLVAVLTGKKAYGGELLHPPAIDYFDEWPLIWKNYSNQGYTTLFAEDLPDFNMFNYLSTGFKNPPTDYYMRPFWLAVQDSLQLRSSSHLCLGSRPRHQYLIDYLKSFLVRNKNQPHFAFSWLAELVHDYLSRASSADESFRDFLKSAWEGGLLNNTFFVFMSDHGHRFHKFRETPMGRLEERLPFSAIVTPTSISKNLHLMGNLEENTNKLTSPYDLHATLVDIMSLIKDGKPLGTTKTEHGISFYGKIPSGRTCNQSGIPQFYCACGLSIEDSNDDEDVTVKKSMGNAIIEKVNSMLNQNREAKVKCEKLSLRHIKSVQRLKVDNENNVTDRRVLIIEAEPSGALFETEVEEITIALSVTSYQVTNEISRINKYKGQSDCIGDAILRKFCFCQT